MQRKFAKPIMALSAGALIGVLAIASCTAPAPQPAPAPPPAPRPAISAPPAAPQQAQQTALAPSGYASLMDAPISQGDWFYEQEASESLAIFGANAQNAQLILRCNKAAKTIGIARPSNAGTPVSMRVRTETEQRITQASPVGSTAALVAAEFAANDPLLTRLAFSNGRFGIEVAGEAPIYPPAWPEITRVIEDCR